MINKIDQYLIDHDVSYNIKFVPVSERPNVLKRRINWIVEITRETSQSFDVWQALSYLPKFDPESDNVEQQLDLISLGSEYQLQIVEFGSEGIHAVKRLQKPDSVYIFGQLLTDHRILEFHTFNDWANKRNFNINNLAVKTNYWNYMVNAIKLQSIFTEKEQEELNTILNN